MKVSSTGDSGNDLDQERVDKSSSRGFRVRRIDAKYWLVAGLALLVVMVYAGAALAADQGGFPLDDSWIHHTYARNLAVSGRWEFVPGVSSAGSTAPLWTILLTLGYLLGLPYLFWSLLLGWICLVWSAWAIMRLWSVIWPDKSRLFWLPGIALVLSWSLVWSAGSSMETLLFIALELQVLLLYYLRVQKQDKSPLGLGLIIGLLVLTRPEGIGMLALITIAMLVAKEPFSSRLKDVLLLLIGAILPLIPYFAFNLWSSGNIWPNTFYAKQIEYASVFSQSLPDRFFRLLYLAMGGPAEGWRGISGAHLLLVLGFILSAIMAIQHDWRKKVFFQSIPLLWALGLIFVYAWRLPVTYQHGRYLFPTIPFWILYGLHGWLAFLEIVKNKGSIGNRLHFTLSRIFWLTFGVLLVIFLMLGLQVYVQDVSFVNGEMVAAAKWLSENTPEESIIATHDIGAVGYFGQRAIVDLAGLISPEVIPLLSDQRALTDYILDSNASYLVTAPGWTYEEVTNSNYSVFEYSTGFDWTLEQGVNNMAVYRLVR